MRNIFQTMKNALNLLLKQPKLFLPKIIISLLYGISILWVANATLDLLELDVTSLNYLTEVEREIIGEIMLSLLLAFLYVTVILILDTLVNAMYPKMIGDYYDKNKISFRKAFSYATKKARIVIPVVLITMLIFLVASLPFNLLFDYFLLSNNSIGMIFSILLMLIVIFTFEILFFLLYPIATLEKVSIISSIKRTVSLGRTNFKLIAVAAIFPFLVSFINFALALLSTSALFFTLFLLLRLIQAVLATYNMVLNPVFYFEYVRQQKF